MPAYGDIRQQIILALESQGADALTILIQAIEDLKNKQAALSDGFNATGKNADDYIKKLQQLDAQIKKLQGSFQDAGNEFATMSELQKALGGMEQKAAKEAVDGAEAAAGARRHGTQAVVDHIAKVREEADAVERTRVADIEALGQRARARAQLERQVDAGIRDNRQAEGDAMRARIDGYARAEQSSDRWIASQKKLTDATGKGLDSTKAYRGSLMSVAYALDDVRYGFGAIVNNIPQLALAAGATSAWAAGIAIAGIGVFELGKALAPVATQYLKDFGLMEDAARKVATTTGEAKEKLEALGSIQIKTGVDYIEITNATKELEKLTALESAYQRLKGGKTEEQQKRSDVVSKAIIEGGGATDYDSGVENIIHSVEGLLPVNESAKGAKAKVDIAEFDRRINVSSRDVEAKGGSVRQIAEAQYDEFMRDALIKLRDARKKDMLVYQSEEERARDLAARNIVSGAGKGDEGARAKLQQLFEGNQEAFTNRGIDPLRFGAGLANAAPAELFADERRKMATASAEKLKRQAEQAEVERIRHEQGMKADREREWDKGVGITHQVLDADDRGAEAEELWQMQQNDRIKREGEQAGRKDDAAKMRAMRSIAQSNQRRSRETDPVKTGKAADVAANKQARGERADESAFKKTLADMVTLREISKQQQAQMLAERGFFVEAQKIIDQIKREMTQNRPRRPIRPTNSPNIQR